MVIKEKRAGNSIPALCCLRIIFMKNIHFNPKKAFIMYVQVSIIFFSLGLYTVAKNFIMYVFCSISQKNFFSC